MSPIQQMLLGVGAVATKTYVDNIFSTFLYTGTGANQIIQNDIAIGSSMAGNSINLSDTSEAERLTRTSALSGVSAGKTFTVSAWVFIPNTGTYGQLFYVDTGSQTRFELGFGNYIQIAARNSSNTKFLDVYTASNVPITPGQWNHILVSMDLTNTSNRHVYVNDSSVSMTYDGYGNEDILFNESKVSIFGQDDNNSKLFGHLSNFYFDQTYRNLGTTSNRRLFYAADGTPATGQASLSPVIYYSFDTLSTTNAGSGGDFTFVDSPTLGTFGPYKDTSAANGGMVWIKGRSVGASHIINDTVRGAGNRINSNGSAASSSGTAFLSAFNTNGFSIGNDNDVSYDDQTFSSWSFRKAKGFFTICEWTGNATNRTISHDLGCVPGLILIKRTDVAADWMVYHRSLNGGVDPGNYRLHLNTTVGEAAASTVFNNTEPTSTTFSIGTHYDVNGNNGTFVAYVFAGGESTAATARSVDFDGSDDQLNIPDSTDWDLGNGDFTLETWIKSTQTTSGYFTALGQWQDSGNNRSWMIRYASQDIGTGWSFFYSTNGSNYTTTMGSDISDGQWHHIAVTRTGGNLRTFTDGILNTTRSTSDTFYAGAGTFTIGGQSGNYFDGQLSNVRLVKGTALYTSSFRPPTEPLTNVTNTKLLCCNNSSVTGSTVTPGTITASSSPTASTDSPFDDPAGFKFGDTGDQNVIKCGSYVGNGSSTGPEINLGWEPQWLLIKQSDGTGDWTIFDSMRGIVTGGTENYLHPNSSDQETTGLERVDLTSTGFKLTDSGWINYDTKKYIFCAIRRPDGYVGKPPELGTSVFNMVMGTSNSDIPTFVSGFVTDFAFNRQPASSENWWTQSRITGDKYLVANNTDAESTSSPNEWDFMNGWYSSTSDFSNQQSWMWKRHAGFDVVVVKPQTGVSISHGLGRTPEMIWAKDRGQSAEWSIYHKGLNGGTNPEQYRLKFTSDSEQDTSNAWNDTAPTATNFTTGSWMNNNPMLVMLFASVDGISKVGSYTGTGGSGTISGLGFTPRFLILKKSSGDEGWYVFDTTRGWGSGNDQVLYLNSSNAQFAYDVGQPTSDGFTVDSAINDNNQNYIYYAHA